MKTRTLKPFLLIALALAGALAGTAPQVPTAPSAAVAALRNINLDPNVHVDPQIRRNAFDAGLATLAARPDASFAGPDAALELELARIGRDRQARPEVYARALMPLPNPRPYDRGVRQAHPDLAETEAERLVWEYLLLVPHIQDEGGASFLDTLNALERIGNDACVPVLVEAFRKDFDYAVAASAVCANQQTILNSLEAFQSERSLDAILDCAAAAERQLQRLDARIAATVDRYDRMRLETYRWFPLVVASYVGSSTGNAPGGKRWDPVLATYHQKDADPLKAWVLAHVRTSPYPLPGG